MTSGEGADEAASTKERKTSMAAVLTWQAMPNTDHLPPELAL
jgi:hypothetical protein